MVSSQPFLAKKNKFTSFSQLSNTGVTYGAEERLYLFDGESDRLFKFLSSSAYFEINFANAIDFDFVILKNCNFKNFLILNFDNLTSNWYGFNNNYDKNILINFEKDSTTKIQIYVSEFITGDAMEIGEVIVSEKLFTFPDYCNAIPKINNEDNVIINRLSDNTYNKVFIKRCQNINIDVPLINATDRQSLADIFKICYRDPIICVPNPRPRATVQKDPFNRIVTEDTSRNIYFDGIAGNYHWNIWDFDNELGNSGLKDYTGFMDLWKASNG